MKLLILAAASLAVVSCASLSLEDLEFHAWKLKFGKVYSSPEEEARRKDIWLSTRRRVLAHNILADQGIKTYRMGMNHLSDMDEHEFMTLYSSLLPEDLNSTAQCTVVPPTPLDGTPLPASKDWRETGCVTPVKNQRRCGSCWAFSAVGALESHACIKHRQRCPTALSEQQLVDCSRAYGNCGCCGGNVERAFQYCKDNNGIVTENFYPYKAKNSLCLFTNTNPMPSNEIGARCSGYQRVPGDELSLQRAVALEGPVSISISVYPSFHSYKSGVYFEPKCNSPNRSFGHAMLVVGYGTTGEGLDYWLVKNSHGTTFGENGYIRMARNRNNNCGIASRAVFPVVQ